MEDGMILNNIVSVDLEKIIDEGIKKLKEETGVEIKYSIPDGKIRLILSGDSNNILVLKDRLGVKEKSSLTENSAVESLKRALSKVLDDQWKDLYTLQLKSIDDNDPELIHISLEVNIDTIPYPVRVTYHLANDGYVSMSYSVWGDVEKDERWSSTSITNPILLDKLKGIEKYYSVRHIEE